MADKDIVLKGTALKAIVRAAEARGAGLLVKQKFLADLGLVELELDLREHDDPEPAVLPRPPVPATDEDS